MNNNDIINYIEKKYINKINIPYLKTGYVLEVKIWVIEGKKKRLQSFKGILISIKNNRINSSITLRKIFYGEGVERVFKIYSPIINSIKIYKKYFFNKSKLYYLRNKNNF